MQVEYSKIFVKELRNLSPAAQKQIKMVIDNLKAAHQLLGIVNCIPLAGGTNEYRIRKGDYRVLFSVKSNTIILHHVLPRGQAYKKHNIK